MSKTKQRFKGMENFLRKIAFNLGNTPSQTEVKVISCIPIDVTDLQQKIVQLEKQLEAVSNSKPSPKETSVLCTRPYSPSHKQSNAAVSCKLIGCRQSITSLQNITCCLSKQTRSNVSLLYPSKHSYNQGQDCYFSADVSEVTYTKKHNPEYRKNFFNKKKFSKKKNLKTRLIYYAQTDNITPFNNYSLTECETSKGNEQKNCIDRSYLTDIVRKQYLPEPVNEDPDASEFSTPICRDVTHIQNVTKPQPYESDLCSCCHGEFRNIDHQVNKCNHFDIFSSHTDSKNSYYDSNLYDVVPVKENTVKVKNIEVPKRKEPKKKLINAILQDNNNTYPIYKLPPLTVNYTTIAPTRQRSYKKRIVKPLSRNEQCVNIMAKKPIPLNRQTNTMKSRPRSVEAGDVYVKQLERSRRKISKPTHTKATNRYDAACLTIVNTECQTTSDNYAKLQENKKEENTKIPLYEDKTKATLNQIKDILQSVLTEVKTNNKLSNIPAQMKKKDAVVQNGPSQSHLYGGPSPLQTLTYNPQDIDPYLLSCSQQLQSSHLGYTNMVPGSMKCMQHYPLLIQPGQNMCSSCYRNNPQANQLTNSKRAASTATNTEGLRARNKETENLIKEIYKAMALNIELQSDDTLVMEHGDTVKNTKMNSNRTENKDIAKAISEIFKSTNAMDTSISQKTDTPFESKFELTKTNLRKQSQSDRNYVQIRQLNDYYKGVNSMATHNNETEQVSRGLDSDDASDVTVVNEENQSSTSETETDDGEDDVVEVEEPNEKNDKKGIFRKMIKLFTTRSRHIKKNKGDKYMKSLDNSTDRTVRSLRAADPPAPKATDNKSRPIMFFSKGPKSQSPEKIPKRSGPYMEQEYRRYFDEKLMFHDNHSPLSSSRGTNPRRKPAYYHKVQARSALVDHSFTPTSESAHNSPKMETKSMKQYRYRHQGNDTRSTSDSPGKALIVPGKTWIQKNKLGIHCRKISGRNYS